VGFFDFVAGRPPKGQEEGRNWSYDWCRFRRDSHCYYPKTLNNRATAEAGYAVWNPYDQGMCPRAKWKDQMRCPAPSEPGPNVPGGFTDATVAWADGGQRDGYPGQETVIDESPQAEHRRIPKATRAKKAAAAVRRPPRATGLPKALTNLADLHSAGKLTDAEFTAAKERLITRRSTT
jgi:hypothetical protein